MAVVVGVERSVNRLFGYTGGCGGEPWPIGLRVLIFCPIRLIVACAFLQLNRISYVGCHDVLFFFRLCRSTLSPRCIFTLSLATCDSGRKAKTHEVTPLLNAEGWWCKNECIHAKTFGMKLASSMLQISNSFGLIARRDMVNNRFAWLK